jgi:hypothetical protein
MASAFPRQKEPQGILSSDEPAQSKKTGFAGERFKKALLFSSHFLVVSGQKSEEFSSFYFANLR